VKELRLVASISRACRFIGVFPGPEALRRLLIFFHAFRGRPEFSGSRSMQFKILLAPVGQVKDAYNPERHWLRYSSYDEA
jgi:hypothetical protein